MIESLNNWTGLLVAIFTIGTFLVGAFLAGWRLGKASRSASEKREILKQRLEKVYGPLRASLLGCHISTARIGDLRSCRERIRDSFRDLVHLRVRAALREIRKYRDNNPAIGVDCGHFPMNEIREIASRNAHVADAKLLDLIHAADRAGWEAAFPGRGPDDLTEEDLALANHIWDEYTQLTRKVGG
ncbi:MAG: hypothetical protein NTV86_03240 [Planctomycetota bacterium]|nr:hypothetical protein [Planctomycetota bacterium]